MTEPTTVLDPAVEPAGQVLSLVTEGYRVLAEIHDAVNRSGVDPTEAHQHVTNATRELAAIQQLYDRRGK